MKSGKLLAIIIFSNFACMSAPVSDMEISKKLPEWVQEKLSREEIDFWSEMDYYCKIDYSFLNSFMSLERKKEINDLALKLLNNLKANSGDAYNLPAFSINSGERQYGTDMEEPRAITVDLYASKAAPNAVLRMSISYIYNHKSGSAKNIEANIYTKKPSTKFAGSHIEIFSNNSKMIEGSISGIIMFEKSGQIDEEIQNIRYYIIP